MAEGKRATSIKTSGRRRRTRASPPSASARTERFSPEIHNGLRPWCAVAHAIDRQTASQYTGHAAMAASCTHLSCELSPRAPQLPPLSRCPGNTTTNRASMAASDEPTGKLRPPIEPPAPVTIRLIGEPPGRRRSDMRADHVAARPPCR